MVAVIQGRTEQARVDLGRKRIVVRHVAVELLKDAQLCELCIPAKISTDQVGQLSGGGSCRELLLESVIGHIDVLDGDSGVRLLEGGDDFLLQRLLLSAVRSRAVRAPQSEFDGRGT